MTKPSKNYSSVSTDDLTVATAPTGSDDALRWQEGAETGVVTGDGVDNSTGNNDWGQAANNNVSETFGNAFGATPTIVGSIDVANDNVPGNEYTFEIVNKSTTGFDAGFLQMAATDNSGTTDAYAIMYIATLGR